MTVRASTTRRAWRGWLSQIGLFLLAMVALHFWNVRHVAHGRAPALAGTTLDGRAITLASFAGQPVLVHFWATWCGVCRAEESSIADLAGHRPAVTIASSSGEAAKVRQTLAERGVAMPVLNDPAGALAEAWGVSAFPTSFVVGPDGRIRFVEVGYTSELGLRARLWLAGL